MHDGIFPMDFLHTLSRSFVRVLLGLAAGQNPALGVVAAAFTLTALIAANERAMGANIVDLRGIAMERLEARLDRLERRLDMAGPPQTATDGAPAGQLRAVVESAPARAATSEARPV